MKELEVMSGAQKLAEAHLRTWREDGSDVLVVGLVVLWQDARFNYPSSVMPAADTLGETERNELARYLRSLADRLEVRPASEVRR